MDISVLPSPLRRFLAQLDELRSAGVLDMDQVGRVLVELAADEEYFGPLIAEMPAESPGGKWLVKPERGPRLVLFHRPEGVMAYTHSHHCWVAIAPVRGVETHHPTRAGLVPPRPPGSAMGDLHLHGRGAASVTADS